LQPPQNQVEEEDEACTFGKKMGTLWQQQNKTTIDVNSPVSERLFSDVTPLFRDLHWLPVNPYIRFKALVLAYMAVSGTAPTSKH